MTDSQPLSARYVHITGVVQGVGFRPFVYNLAARLGLSGWVLNSSSGVEIEAVGPSAVLEDFIERLQSEAPPLSRIERVTIKDLPVSSVQYPVSSPFIIRHSEDRPGDFQPISPDISICDDCLRELLDPGDRRYRTPLSTAPTAARALPSFRTSLTTGPRRPWRRSRCAQIVRPNMMTR